VRRRFAITLALSVERIAGRSLMKVLEVNPGFAWTKLSRWILPSGVVDPKQKQVRAISFKPD